MRNATTAPLTRQLVKIRQQAGGPDAVPVSEAGFVRQLQPADPAAWKVNPSSPVLVKVSTEDDVFANGRIQDPSRLCAVSDPTAENDFALDATHLADAALQQRRFAGSALVGAKDS